jgi:hypothetical protein
MSLTLRLSKGTELTHEELDDNFEYLEGLITASTGSTDYISNVTLTNNTLAFSSQGSAFTGSIDLSSINTNSIDYVSSVTYGAGSLSFTGVGNGFTGSVDISALNTDSVDYISNVALTGTNLVFTGTGSAFNNSVSLAAITGSVSITSTSTSAAPLVLESAAGSSFGTLFLKEPSTAGPILELNQSLISINSSHTIGTLNFTQFTTSWGKIKVQATNTSGKSVMSFFADSTTSPKLIIDGEEDTISLPSLSSGSASNVLGYDTTTGDLTYLSTNSLGGGGGIALTDLSVTTGTASGSGSLAYNSSTGVFTYSPVAHQSYALLTTNGSSTGSLSPANQEDILYFKGGTNVTITAGSSSGTGDFSALTLDTLTFDVDLSGVSGSAGFETGATYLQTVGASQTIPAAGVPTSLTSPIIWAPFSGNSNAAGSFTFGNVANVSASTASSNGVFTIISETFVRVDFTAFYTTSQNNTSVYFAFQTRPSGGNTWTTVKTVTDTTASSGDLVASFWSIFKIANGTDVRIAVGCNKDTGVSLTAGTQLEIKELS